MKRKDDLPRGWYHLDKLFEIIHWQHYYPTVVLGLLCPNQMHHKFMEDVISTAQHDQQSDDHSDEGDVDEGVLSYTGKKYHLHLSTTCCCSNQQKIGGGNLAQNCLLKRRGG